MPNRTPFAQRVITALIFGLILLAPIFIGKITGMTIIGILCLLTVLEYLLLQGQRGWRLYLQTFIAVFMYLSICMLVLQQGIIYAVEYAVGLCVAFCLLLTYRLWKHECPFAFRIQALPAALYIALPLAFLYTIALWDGQYRPRLVVALLLLIWTNDTLAYLVGRRWGKHVFAPVVSPKKTWEGTIGGWLGCLAMAIVLHQIIGVFSLPIWLLTGLVVGLTGSVGDLIESMFKRKKQIKDSGTFLPGHGGFLDRLDSLLFALPFITLLFLLAR